MTGSANGASRTEQPGATPAARGARSADVLQDGRRDRASRRRRLVRVSRPGQTLGVVGESGSGKSVTMMSILGLNPKPGRLAAPGRLERDRADGRRSWRASKKYTSVSTGAALFRGENLLEASSSRLRSLRGSEISMIFQDPMTSLNPVLSVGDQLDRGGDAAPRRHARGRRASWRSPGSRRSASRAPAGASTTTRTSSPAACGSA